MKGYYVMIYDSSVVLYGCDGEFVEQLPFISSKHELSVVHCACVFDYNQEKPAFVPEKSVYGTRSRRIFVEETMMAGWTYSFEDMYGEMVDFILSHIPDKNALVTFFVALSDENKMFEKAFNRLKTVIKPIAKRHRIKKYNVLDWYLTKHAALDYVYSKIGRTVIDASPIAISGMEGEGGFVFSAFDELKAALCSILNEYHVYSEVTIDMLLHEVLKSEGENFTYHVKDYELAIPALKLKAAFENHVISAFDSLDKSELEKLPPDSVMLIDFASDFLNRYIQSVIVKTKAPIKTVFVGDIRKYFFRFALEVAEMNRSFYAYQIRRDIKKMGVSKRYMPRGTDIYRFHFFASAFGFDFDIPLDDLSFL